MLPTQLTLSEVAAIVARLADKRLVDKADNVGEGAITRVHLTADGQRAHDLLKKQKRQQQSRIIGPQPILILPDERAENRIADSAALDHILDEEIRKLSN